MGTGEPVRMPGCHSRPSEFRLGGVRHCAVVRLTISAGAIPLALAGPDNIIAAIRKPRLSSRGYLVFLAQRLLKISSCKTSAELHRLIQGSQ